MNNILNEIIRVMEIILFNDHPPGLQLAYIPMCNKPIIYPGYRPGGGGVII